MQPSANCATENKRRNQLPDTNFLQWNPTATNQENDGSYTTDAQRTGGAAVGTPFPSLTANKLFYQLSTFVSALAFAMVSKGYSPVDGTSPLTAAGSPTSAVGNLALVLENLIANSDLQDGSSPYVGAFLQNASLSGTSTSTTPSTTDDSDRIATTQYVQRQNYVAGSSTPQLIQHGSNGGGTSITFPTPFSAVPDVALGPEGGTSNIVNGSISTTGFQINLSSGGQIVHWLAIGNR